ncbi:MAG: carboxypeptidase-like regulatory domain-containing protein, partial [Flavobacterium sp.]
MKNFLFLFLLISMSSWSQFRFQGIVRDSNTQKPVPFATLHAKGISILTDVNGFFEWKSEIAIDVVTISYLGYERQVVKVNPKVPMKILLTPKENREETTQAAAEKGKAVILKVHARASSNNPQIRLNTFKHNGYHRLVVTATPDSIKGTIDSTYSKKEKKFTPDSTSFKFKELISKQHLFQFEKSSKYQFNGEQFKETVIGTKMSGFKKPVYEVIAFDLQPQSVYNNLYELFETKYTNPISKLGLKSYHFVWLDSVKIDGRKTQLVYFKNKKRSLRRGLEGVLFVDDETFGIAKAIYRIRGVLDISSLHYFNFESTLGLWLPSKNEFKIVKGQNDDPIKILGGTIRFDGSYDPFNENTKSEISDFVYVFAQSQFYDWEYNLPVHFKRKHITLDIPDEAIKRDD